MKQPLLAPHYVLEVSREERLDRLDVIVELKPDAVRVSHADRLAAGARLEHEIKAYVGVTTHVRVTDLGSVERSIGKAKRVIDRRPKA